MLAKLRDFGRVLNKGINRVEFTLNHRPHVVQASFTAGTLERIRQRIAQPGPRQQTIQGRLLMADFKETAQKVRVHPAIGAPVLCHFPENLAGEVEECMRQFVRVTGTMSYQPGDEPHCLEIADIEQVEPPETASTVAEGGPGWAYDFWESPSAEEYARRQGTPVASDPSQLYGPGEPADWAGFDEALERWRAESPVG